MPKILQKKPETLERICEPCPECTGAGYQSISEESKITYVPCDFCNGDQCFYTKTGEPFYEKCDESCGHNRESLKENWTKM
jgi:hypothetical protein